MSLRSLLVLPVLLLGSCLTAEGTGAGCADCHGSPETNWAPPKALGGETDRAYIGVGTHQAHVTGAKLGSPVACVECHVVPSSQHSEGHMDTPWPAEVTWGPLTLTGEDDREVVWDRDTQTCSNSYCHSGREEGTYILRSDEDLDGNGEFDIIAEIPEFEYAAVPNPVWNVSDPAISSCDGCHGNPPAPILYEGERVDGHPLDQGAPCSDCHNPTAVEGGGPIDNPATHMDGIAQWTTPPCNVCHGSGQFGLPPPDLAGGSDTSLPSVGAHQAHDPMLAPDGDFAPVPCQSCHIVPNSVNTVGHLDSAPAEVIFSGLGAGTTWDGTNFTCSNAYCHGAATSGGAVTEPVWTTVDGSQVQCGSCHGMPPEAPHDPSDRCEECHATVAGPNQTIIDPGLHVNGTTEFGSCAAGCHGDDFSTAPPPDTQGNTDTSLTTVGAHRAHVDGGANSEPVPCESCHRVPDAVGDAGHLDLAPAEVIFTGLADQFAGATWNNATSTCSNSYCHGAASSGGSATEPVWTTVDGSQVTCGGCHGMPPDAPHPGLSSCDVCHSSVAGAGQTLIDPTKHINGATDF